MKKFQYLLESLRKSCSQTDPKVLFYASSGPYLPEYSELPFDFVFLSDKHLGSFQIYKDRVILLPCDNNMALRLCYEVRLKINCFVGIRDGCCEGGNYECVNSTNFFGRLSALIADSAFYITDHFFFNAYPSRKFRLDVPFDSSEVVPLPSWATDYLQPAGRQRPQDKIRMWNIKRKRPTKFEKKLGHIHVVATRESIFEAHLSKEIDGMFVPKNWEKSLSYFFHNETAQTFLFFPDDVSKRRPLTPLLIKAKEMGWKKIGLVPIWDGKYNHLLEEISGWSDELPNTIVFYHLHENDLREIYES